MGADLGGLTAGRISGRDVIEWPGDRRCRARATTPPVDPEAAAGCMSCIAHGLGHSLDNLPKAQHGPMAPSIQRTVLIDEVFSHGERRLVLIEAPSGSGKSTLLRQIAAKLALGTSRVRLIELGRDADTITFAHDLLAALGATDREGGGHGAESTAQLTLQVEQVARGLKVPTCVLIDDFQRVISADALTLVTRLLYLDPAPPLTLMIASRVAAGLAVAALRLRGEVLELGEQDLNLSNAEAMQMLHAFGARVPREVWLGFVRKAGGWAVALRLALVLLRDQRLVLDDLPDFSGRQRDMAAYLSQLVVEAVPPEDRNLLFQAAAFERLRPDVMAAAIGPQAAGRMLRLLATLALPLEGGEAPETRRLHGLVAEFFEAEAKAAGVNLCAIRSRAAEYLARQGEWRKAISVALRSGDLASAASIAERGGGWRLIYRGEDGAPQQFSELARLAPQDLAATPRTILGLAISAAKRGEIDVALNRIEQAHEVIASDQTELQAELRLVMALLDLYCDRDTPAEVIAQLEADITPMTGVDPVRLALTRNLLCFFSLQACRFDAAIRFGRLSIRDFRAAGSDFGAAHLPIHIGQAEFLSGQVENGLATLARHAQHCLEELGPDADLTLMTQVLMHEVRLEGGHISHDTHFLEQAFEQLGHRDSWYDPLASALVSCTSLTLLEGANPDRILQRAELIAGQRYYHRLTALVELLRAEALLRLGQFDDAARLLAIMARPPTGPQAMPGRNPVSMRGPLPGMLLARLALARGEFDQALGHLDEATVLSQAQGNIPRLMRLAALRLRILLTAGRADLAWSAVLDLTAQHRLDHVCLAFVEEGAAIRDFLAERLADLDTDSMVWRRLQPVIDLGGRHFRTAREQGAVSLTGSEASVLARLERGLSNKEIARTLGISDNTVKFHLANIYRKLGAGNRTVALWRARDLGLLLRSY